jgi:mono/diheme cytochrome c family protein
MKPQFCALLTALAVTSMSSLAAGCRGQTSKEAPVAILRNMYQQPRYNPQAYSAYFADHRTMRPPVTGTVAREMELSASVAEGRTQDGKGFVDTIPSIVIERNGKMKGLLERGEERYGVYCTPCHDGLGNGNGMVIQRAANPGFKPPSFHTERVRQMTDGQLFQTVTYGYNNMPAYGAQVPIDDRWAIVSYVRALQLANNRGAEQ